MALRACRLPGRKLKSTVIGRVKKTSFGKGSPKKGQLAQADGFGFTLHPSGIRLAEFSHALRTTRLTRRGRKRASKRARQLQRVCVALGTRGAEHDGKLYGHFDMYVRLKKGCSCTCSWR